jgi:hypothetical protein
MPQHSILSASGAAGWMNCAGRPNATRGLVSPDNAYTLEGTAAHSFAQQCLADGRDAHSYIGAEFHGHTVTTTMAADVQIYLDTCTRLIDATDLHLIEHQFSLEKLSPPVPMFGTCDFLAYSRKRRELHVVDLKFGKGVWVAARDNPQLLYYAVGAALTIDEPVSTVTMTVVQPRFAKGDPVRTSTIDAIALVEWSFHLIDRAHATQEPDAPRTAGDWCRFCAAKNSCLTFQNQEVSAAYHEFVLADVHQAQKRPAANGTVASK